MNIIQSLSTLGLEKREAELYTYLLKQPKGAEQTAFTIAQGINMPRSTVYLTLQTLEGKRLVSSYKKNNVLHYLTADPSRLTRDLEEKQDLLSTILPTLKKLSEETAHTSSVQTFTGAKGVKIVFDDVYDNPHLKGIREFHTISHPKLTQYLPKILPKKMELKKKLNIFTKMIVPEFVKANVPKEYVSDSHRETRFLTNSFSFEGTLIIYGKKTALFSHRDNEVYSMIIDSPAITEMFEAVFLCLWGLLPANPTPGTPTRK